MSVIVRGARGSDVDVLVQNTLGNAFESEGIRLDVEVVKRGTQALLKDPHKGRLFVAEDDGRVIGSCYVTFEWSDWHDAWYWWLQSVFVRADRRGQGVYTKLWDAVGAAAVKEGNVRCVRLYVEHNNEAALRAYRGHGMQEMHYKVFEKVLLEGRGNTPKR